MFPLSKVLPLLVLPVIVTLALIVAGAIRRSNRCLYLAAALLCFSSVPLVSDSLMRFTEGWATRNLVESMPSADATVVLSTGRVLAPGGHAISEWTDADRFFAGVDLFHAGKSPLLIFTGGAAATEANSPLEGDVLAARATAFGVPADQIANTGRVVNTAEEARAVASLLRDRHVDHPRVLLVTSAFHMARARRLFERAGIVVLAFPVDFQVSAESRTTVLTLMPTAEALAHTQLALRELLGRLFYLVATG